MGAAAFLPRTQLVMAAEEPPGGPASAAPGDAPAAPSPEHACIVCGASLETHREVVSGCEAGGLRWMGFLQVLPPAKLAAGNGHYPTSQPCRTLHTCLLSTDWCSGCGPAGVIRTKKRCCLMASCSGIASRCAIPRTPCWGGRWPLQSLGAWSRMRTACFGLDGTLHAQCTASVPQHAWHMWETSSA